MDRCECGHSIEWHNAQGCTYGFGGKDICCCLREASRNGKGCASWKEEAVDKAIRGVGKSEPMETINGATVSKSPYRADLLPPRAILEVARVLKEGDESHPGSTWTNIPVEYHLNHAIVHILAHLAGDTQDDHLGHAACSLLMALEVGLK